MRTHGSHKFNRAAVVNATARQSEMPTSTKTRTADDDRRERQTTTKFPFEKIVEEMSVPSAVHLHASRKCNRKVFINASGL